MTDRAPTLGWDVIAWAETYLVHGPGDVQGQPLRLSDDAARFLLDLYRLEEGPDGRWRRRATRAFYSRPKGSAKSETGGVFAAAELCGPVMLDGFDANGDPVGRPRSSPFVRLLATEETQTDNTYGAVRTMLTDGPIADELRLDVGLTRTYLVGPRGDHLGEIRPCTAGAASKDGGKETAAVADETHLYTLPELRTMYATVRRNLGKRRGTMLETSTMYAAGEESVAEATHRYARAVADGKLTDAGLLFDHKQGPTDFDYDDDQLRAALAEAYDGIPWVDLDGLVAYAREPDTAELDVRRYFLNQPTASASAWIPPDTWAACADEDVRPLEPGDTVCAGFDGSRGTDGRGDPADATAIVVVRTEDRAVFLWHLQEHEREGDAWHPDRHAVNAAVDDLHERFDVVRAYADPPGWETDVARWEGSHGWDGWATYRAAAMTGALERFETAVRAGNVRHDGDVDLTRHVVNATVSTSRRGQRPYRKLAKRAARDKIDAAVAAVLAVEALYDAEAAGELRKRRKGRGRTVFL